MIEIIKKVAEQVFESMKPTTIIYGTVETVSPLSVRIDQKKLLEAEDLILSHFLRDHYVDVTVSHKTESIYGSWDTSHSHPDAGTSSLPIDHKHEYKGRKKILVHYGLKEGEKLALIRIQGGQMYYIIDRLEDPIVEGEWI